MATITGPSNERTTAIKENVVAELDTLRSLLRMQELQIGTTSNNQQQLPPTSSSQTTVKDIFDTDWQKASKNFSIHDYQTRHLFRTSDEILTKENNSSSTKFLYETKLQVAEDQISSIEKGIDDSRADVANIRASTKKNWEKIAADLETEVARQKKRVLEKEAEIIKLRNELTRSLQGSLEADDRLGRRAEAAIERNTELHKLLSSAQASNKVMVSQFVSQKSAVEGLKGVWQSQIDSERSIKLELHREISALNERMEAEANERLEMKETMLMMFETIQKMSKRNNTAANATVPPKAPKAKKNLKVEDDSRHSEEERESVNSADSKKKKKKKKKKARSDSITNNTAVNLESLWS